MDVKMFRNFAISAASLLCLLFSYGCSNLNAESDLKCERLISEVTIIPFRSGSEVAGKYNYFIQNSEDDFLKSCLLESVTNTNSMPDPRESMPLKEVATGDVAVFLLVRMYNLRYQDILPRESAEKWQDQGIFAYFESVETLDGRMQIQNNIRENISN